MTLTPGNHIAEDDLVLFALQLLPEDRMRQAKQHVEVCDLCHDEIAKLQGDLVAYSMTSDIQAPPPVARERLMRQVEKEPRASLPEPLVGVQDRIPARMPDRVPDRLPTRVQEHDSGEPTFPTRHTRTLGTERHEVEREAHEEDRRPRRAPWVLAWTGWAVAAGCSFVAGLQFHQRQQMQTSMDVQQARLDDTTRQAIRAQDALATLTASGAMQMPLHTTAAVKPATPGTAPTPSPEALVAYLADKGALVFIATHLQPAPSGKTYELWLLPDNGRNPIPAGTFKPGAQGSASVVMPDLPKGVPAKGFGVTLENEGGADTPTLPILMAPA